MHSGVSYQSQPYGGTHTHARVHQSLLQAKGALPITLAQQTHTQVCVPVWELLGHGLNL